MLIAETGKGNPIWEVSNDTELSIFIRESGILLTSSVLEEYFKLKKEEFREKKNEILDLHREAIKSDEFMGTTFDLRNGKFLIKPL